MPQLRLVMPGEREARQSERTSREEWERAFHEHVWARWPRKVDKADALRSWMRMLPTTAKAAQELFDAFMDWMDRAVPVYSQREPQHRPHLSTCINRKRWLDEEV